MSTYRITERMTTYAVVDIEAESAEEALRLVAESDGYDLDWSYETDYDSAQTDSFEKLS